jgi:hypothetical protein
MDFGIAKLTNQETGLTQTGMTLGTAAYLAPEQIRGETIGPTTDIFSWGVTAWELLAYTRPFTGQHISTVLYQILNERQPKLQDVAPDVPPEIVAIVDRCLEKKPERRFQSCADLLRELDKALQARRASATGGMGTLAAESQAEIAETRSIAARTAPASEGARTASLPASPAGLGDFDLEGTGDVRRTPHSISATQAMRSRGFSWGTWAGVVAGVLLVAAVAAWLLQQSQASRHRRVDDIAAASPIPGLAVDASVTPTPAASTPPPTPEPSLAPTPSPTPKPSYVVVAAAWSPEVWVTIGKQRRRLDREQRFTVPAGANTTVRFDYEGRGFRDGAQSTVRVDAGATVRVPVPLSPPGLIQVQQKLGTPMGRVVLDGTDLGLPIVRQSVKAGAHHVRIDPSAPGTGAIDEQVEVPAGKKLVLTFDLAAGRLNKVVGELPGP